MTAYLITVFLSSFLVFQVQPLIGRYILPWFGGSPAVWTTCMLFFQGVLLAGYGYAHALTNASPKKQAVIHLALLIAALAFLPIAPSSALWKSTSADFPIARILMLLTVTIGAPYLILSATAPLVQHWFARSYPERSPYRLYALSNTGSLLALVSYPFVVEPNLTLRQQVAGWSWGFFAFVLCCAWCAIRQRSPSSAGKRGAAAPGTDTSDTVQHPPCVPLSAHSTLLWLILSACGSAALLATTNQICQEVAVVPFLWVAPLSLYLATFIICFNSDRGYSRTLWGILFAVAAVPACWLLQARTSASLPLQLLVFLGVLFACCMACHGELARSRPRPQHLTAYYLVMSAGGVLGGVFVALVAPLAFKGFWELPVVLTASAAALAWAYARGGGGQWPQQLRVWCAAAAVLALATFTTFHITDIDRSIVARSRNFYGVLRVVRWSDRHGPLLYLLNGRVLHGFQYTKEYSKSVPTSYYTPPSGVGLALRYHPRRLGETPAARAIRVGVIGLGTGTVASYGRRGDIFRFYEINDDVISFADRYFTYLRDSAGTIEMVPGDARVMLESETSRGLSQQFDVLVVDAFTSDSIPLHLLTRECFAVYWRHLKRDGLLVMHVTNHFLDLVPVIHAQATGLGLQAVTVRSPIDQEKSSEAVWMILTRNGEFLKRTEVSSRVAAESYEQLHGPVWCDDFVSLWQVLKR